MGQTFWADHSEAKQKEQQFAHALQSHGFTTTLSTDKGCFPDWDVQGYLPQTNKTLTFEVKLDRYYGTTSTNVAIEVGKTVQGKHEPSGVMTSKAHFYVYTFASEPGTFYITLTSILKELYTTCSWERKVKTYDSATAVYDNVLINGDLLKSYCKKISAP